MHPPRSSSTYTETYTIPPAEPPTLGLVQRMLPIEGKLKDLLVRIKEACERLSSDKREIAAQAVAEWELKIFQDFQLDSPLTVERDKAAYAICFFYVHRVEYIMLNYADTPEEQVAWLTLGDELKEILSGLLPDGRNVDEFLDTYIDRESERKCLQELEKIIDTMPSSSNAPSSSSGNPLDEIFGLLDRLEDDWYRRSNESNATSRSEFEILKGRLLQLMGEVKISTEEIYQRLDPLTERATQLSQFFGANLKEAQVVLAQVEEQGRVMEIKLVDVQTLLDETK